MKTADIFKKKTVFSLEIFPPKPDSDESVIYDTLEQLSDIRPDFISVTYGAGGGKNGCKTIKIASDIVTKYGVSSVAHLPCINHTKEQITQILDSITASGIDNVLALRGDIPEGCVLTGDFRHANELVTFINDSNFPHPNNL